MKATLVRIGNSRGIRIPKLVIEQCRFEDDVEMEVQRHKLVIHSPKSSRAGWGEAFKQMAERGDDRLLDQHLGTSRWDEDEWQWK